MIDWLEQHMLPCPIEQLSGSPCPGCGMQRAIIELLRGNLSESFIYYPALIPLILMLLFLFLHLILDIRQGAKILKYFFITNAIFISLSYLIKLINLQ